MGRTSCDICGSDCCIESTLSCTRGLKGCPIARHLWCFDDHSTVDVFQNNVPFLCLHCAEIDPQSRGTRLNATIELSKGKRSGSMNEAVACNGQRQAKGPDASGAAASSDPKAQAEARSGGREAGGEVFTFAAKEGVQNGGLERGKAQKRASGTALTGSKPSKARMEAPPPAAAPPPVNLLDQVMRGQQQERERQEMQRRRSVIRQEQQQAGGGGAASESASEQRLKRKQRNPLRELTLDMQERQRKLVAASVKEKSIWSGQLEMQLPDKEDALVVDVQAYCMVGNAHAMDASLKLPKQLLRGTVVDSRDALEMTVVEAAEYACLVLKGAHPDSDRAFSTAISAHLSSNTKMLRVHIGEDKPLWMGLLPGPANSGCCLAVLVRYEDAWRHSEKVPEKGLLQKERRGHKRKLAWPDHQRVDRKSADLERDRGPDYGHLRLDRAQAEPPGPGESPANPQPRSLEEQEFLRQEAKPLADFSVALVGFDKNHADIVTLRKQLKQCGAHTYPSPWPGCCQVIVLPEQLINKELSLENHSLREMEPLRDYLLSGTRIFNRLDYPRLCCQYGRRLTREEELKHGVKDVWPEGAVFVGDAETLHAAGTASGGRGPRSLLEELLRELHQAATSAKVPGSVWQVMLSHDHLKQLKEMASPALPLLEKWGACKRFAPIDPAMAATDLLHNAMKLAQFYRHFCRYTVVLARATDTELFAAVEARKMIHCVAIEEAPAFLRSQVSRP